MSFRLHSKSKGLCMKLSGGSRIYWGAGRSGEAAAGSTHGAQEVVYTEAEERWSG